MPERNDFGAAGVVAGMRIFQMLIRVEELRSF
jgi:hypothetical protein